MEPGSAIGHYRIVRLLGRGGMGEVYEAQDERLGRSVALKVLPVELAGDPERRARLEREAKAAAALQHPNIVTLHALEEDAGRLFLVMELVDGRPLYDLVPAGGMALERFLELAVPLTDAVAAAHARGIVHRDLKPSNVLVDRDSRVRVLDFGLARLEEVVLPGAETMGPTEALTGGGQIVGTVAYMSPEQAEGKPVDGRSDIFSLGVVLYEMATGERPFQGDTGMSILTSILRDEPVSVTERNARLPRHLGRIVRRCLQKDPARRYQSALDLRNDLLELREELDSGELTAPAPPPTRRRWLPAAALLLLLVSGAVAAVLLLRGRGGSAPSPEASPLAMRRLHAVGSPSIPAISPDGRYVVYESLEAGLRSLRLHQVGTGSDVELVPAGDWQTRFDGLSFTPDGDWVRYGLGGGGGPRALWEVPALGGVPRRLLEGILMGPFLSPDGKSAAVVRGEDMSEGWRRLEVIALEDGAVRTVSDAGEASFMGLAWAPGGDRLVAALFGGEGFRLAMVSLEGGAPEPLELAQELEFVSGLCWEPDGRSLLVLGPAPGRSNEQLWRVEPATGAVTRLTQDFDAYEGCSLTADGRTLATVRSDERAELWRVPVSRPDEAQLLRTASGRRDGTAGVAWLDDETIVYAAPDERDWQIWSVPASGARARRLTTEGGVLPAVAPAVRRIVYLGGWDQEGGAPGVHAVEPDGTGRRRVSPPGRFADRPALSPDGAWVFYEDYGQEGVVLMRRRWDGTEEAPLVEGSAHLVSYSPSGRRLAVHARDAETEAWRTLILSADFELEKALDLHSESNSPWAGEDALYISRTVEGVGNVFRVPLDDPTAEEQVTRFAEGAIFFFDVSPDRSRLVVSRGEIVNDLLLLDVPR